MTKQKFYKMFHGVKCPSSYGAKTPSFDAAAINEARFAHELRDKEFTTDFEEAKDGVDTVTIKWTSQSWNDDGVDSLVNEVIRCFESIGFVGNVVLDLEDRDGDNAVHREFTVG